MNAVVLIVVSAVVYIWLAVIGGWSDKHEREQEERLVAALREEGNLSDDYEYIP